MLFLLKTLLSLSFSYIPHSHFILKQVGENHGKGGYKVIQEVAFQSAQERIVVQEVWTIDEGLQMHLEAKGTGINYSAKYDFNNKYYLTSKNDYKKTGLSFDFFENILYLREAKDIARRLYRMKAIDSKILENQKRFYHLSQVEYKSQDFIRLARLDDSVTYAFSQSSEPKTSNDQPGFWVSQNDFHLLGLQLPSGVKISLKDYDKYTRNLHLAKLRTIEWQDNKVPVQILSVNNIIVGKETKKLLDVKSTDGLKPLQFSESKLARVIADFYQRFR